jgi:hypothetical protein
LKTLAVKIELGGQPSQRNDAAGSPLISVVKPVRTEQQFGSILQGAAFWSRQ